MKSLKRPSQDAAARRQKREGELATCLLNAMKIAQTPTGTRNITMGLAINVQWSGLQSAMSHDDADNGSSALSPLRHSAGRKVFRA